MLYNSVADSYKYTYDAFGNTTSIKAGNNTLASYSYNSSNGKLNTTTYGNGHAEKYLYDSIDRVSEIMYNSGEDGAFETVYKYVYNGNGSLYSVEDVVNNETIVYTYSISGALTKSYVYDTDTHINKYSSSFDYNDSQQVEFAYYSFDYSSPDGVVTQDHSYYYSYDDLTQGTVLCVN